MTARTLMPTIICKAKHLRQRLDAAIAVHEAQDIDANAPGYTPGLSAKAVQREPARCS